MQAIDDKELFDEYDDSDDDWFVIHWFDSMVEYWDELTSEQRLKKVKQMRDYLKEVRKNRIKGKKMLEKYYKEHPEAR